MEIVVLLLFGCITGLPGGESAIEYYVTSSQTSNKSACNGYQPCHTLDQYIINSSQLFHRYTNYTVVLFSGVHVLTTDLVIFNIEGLEVCSNFSAATIDITHGSLNVQSISNFVLSNILVVRKSELKHKPPKHLFRNISGMIFRMSQLVNVEFEITVNCGGLGFILYNSSLLYSSFSVELKNSLFTIVDSKIVSCMFDIATIYQVRNGGQKRMLYINGCSVFGENFVKLNVSSGHLSQILDISNTKFGETSAVLYVEMQMKIESSVRLNIKHSHITDMTLRVSDASLLRINITESYFGNSHYRTGLRTYFNTYKWRININQEKHSDLLVYMQNSVIKHIAGITITAIKQQNTVIKLYNVTFSKNDQAINAISTGFTLHMYLFNVTFEHIIHSHALQIRAYKSSVELTKCKFVRNYGYRGTCIFFKTVSSFSSNSSLYLNQVVLFKNYDTELNSAIILVEFCKNITINNSLFTDNSGTPIEVILGQIIFSGRTVFENNVARKGGGLSLINSVIIFSNGSRTVFRSNKALNVGGAIFLSHNTVHLKLYSGGTRATKCFFELGGLDVSLNFQNNSAINGGDDLYGTYLYQICFASNDIKLTLNYLRTLFKTFNSKNTSLSAISSDPLRVCICDSTGEPQCARLDFIYLNATLYPGERFAVPLVVVGEEFGTVTGSVHATLLGRTTGSLGAGQNAQRTNVRHCTTVEYSIYSSQLTETVILTTFGETPLIIEQNREILQTERRLNQRSLFVYDQTGEIDGQLLTTHVCINVTLEKCPLGFELAGDPPCCQCKRELVENNIRHCTIMNHTGYVYRSGRVWVNATFREDDGYVLIVHKYCPYGYCLKENTSVDLRHPDTQCDQGHSGTLCGGCQENLSLVLGTNRCLYCPNNSHMALLLFFSAAGLMLVCSIKVLNITVSKGAINGIIFYVNIVWAEQTILFSKETVIHNLINVCVAWLNLDFGIETCFVQGLTAYQKVWLQFLFPVYVWCIVGFMIISAHYSTRATKLFGNNSVPVMATLFLMSYAKLLRTIITVFGFAVLRTTNSSTTVWSFDGNVPYLGLQHAFLFVAAILALLFLWLPYMFTLLVVPLLRGKTQYRPFRWINKWKPFYDAYFGPFRAKHQYWCGALLLVRVFLFILFATTSTTSPNVNLLAVIIVTASLLIYMTLAGPVYKSKYLPILENSFFLNLNILAAGVLYQNVMEGDKELVVYILVGIALMKFFCIALYHCVLKLKSCVTKRNLSVSQSKSRPKVSKKWAFPLREELLDMDSEDSM